MEADAGWRSAVFDALGGVLIVHGPDGSILDCNPAAERILGFSREQLTTADAPLLRCIGPDRAPLPRERHPAVRAARSGIAVRDAVVGLRRPDDTLVWALINAEPIPGTDWVLSAWTDITDQFAGSAERLRATVASMFDSHVLFQADEAASVRVVEINDAALESFGLARDQVVGQVLGELLDTGMAATVCAWVHQVAQTGEPLSLQDTSLTFAPGGAPMNPVDIRAARMGKYVSLTWRDISQRRETARRLAESEELFRTAMHTAFTGVAITDLDGRLRVVNEALCAIVKQSEDELVGTQLLDLLASEHVPAVVEQMRLVRDDEQARTVMEAELKGPDESRTWAKMGIAGIRSGSDRPVACLVQMEDISGEREAREALAHLAFHDALTGLQNRARLIHTLDRLLRDARLRRSRVGVLFIDLDNFKVVNDSLGHAAGDMVISSVAERIGSVLRDGEEAGRFGGDEFVVVVPDVVSAGHLEQVAERVLSAISHEVSVAAFTTVPAASAGIAVSDDSATSESLLRNADAALFRAKDRGRARWHFFDSDMHEQAVSRMTLESQMRQALDEGQFRVHYQPVVQLLDGVVAGYEALVRWDHPDRGLINAGQFVPLAEETGLIVPLGQQVIEIVAGTLARRPDITVPVSVNVSAVQLASVGWAKRFLDSLAAHGVGADRIVVEVTETSVLSMLDRAAEDLSSIRDLGGGVHIDDFGTGYSSIALMRDLPVTGVKLDASFVRSLTRYDSVSNALAAGMAGLAGGLGLLAIAEGIETPEQAAMLAGQGWSHGQGYYFGMPEPL